MRNYARARPKHRHPNDAAGARETEEEKEVSKMPSISLHAMHAMHQSEYFRNKVAEARKRLRRAEVSVPRRLSRRTDPDGQTVSQGTR